MGHSVGRMSKLEKLSLIALGVAVTVPALAQGNSTTEADQASGALEEIVVTARKRSENLQDTPIALTALTQAGLEERQMNNISSIDRFAPNVVFSTSSPISGTSSSASVFIRGVGQTDFLLTTDPGVGIYLDGVYIARSIGSVLDVLDLDQVEVLRGPQGTLFGRNTIGGAISLTSHQPADSFSAKVSVTTGSFDRLDVRASADLPITDTLASSVSVARFGSNGYIDRPHIGDRAGGDDREAARVALAWRPSDTFRLDLSADGPRVREKSCCGELVAVYPGGLFAQFYNAVVAPGLVAKLGSAAYFNQQSLPTQAYQDNSETAVPSDLDLWGVSASAEWHATDSLTAKAITAYRDLQSVNGQDEDHTPLLIAATSDIYNSYQFSQELQLLGNTLDSRMKWILGAYFFDERGLNLDDVDFAIVHVMSGGRVHNDSLAFFGQTTVDITSGLSLTGGFRVTQDTKRFLVSADDQYVISNTAGVPSNLHPGPLMPGDRLLPTGEVSTQATRGTPYVNLAYKWTPDVLTYVSYSEGFKGGGFVQRVFPDLSSVPAFKPEEVKVYEVGFKLETPDRSVRLNGAAFLTDYANLQVTVNNALAPVTANAAAARINGGELELSAVPTKGVGLDVGLGYLDAKYTQVDPNAIGITLDSHLVYAPKWTVNAGGSYEFGLAQTGSITLRSDWSYRATVYNDAANTPALTQPGYGTLSASATWASVHKDWQLIAAGTNITNKRYIVSGFANPAVQSFAEASFGRPAEWSLTLKYQF